MRKFLQKLSGLDRKKQAVNENEDQDELFYDDNNKEYTEENTESTDIEEIENEEETETDQLQKELEEEWPAEEFEEGQLSIDVYQTAKSIVVKSTIAGVKPEDIDISINNDMLTIRGKREYTEEVKDDDYLFQECYWGSFSRSIILPVEVEAEKIDATLENGVLTVTLPKAKNAQQIQIKVKEK